MQTQTHLQIRTHGDALCFTHTNMRAVRGHFPIIFLYELVSSVVLFIALTQKIFTTLRRTDSLSLWNTDSIAVESKLWCVNHYFSVENVIAIFSSKVTTTLNLILNEYKINSLNNLNELFHWCQLCWWQIISWSERTFYLRVPEKKYCCVAFQWPRLVEERQLQFYISIVPDLRWLLSPRDSAPVSVAHERVGLCACVHIWKVCFVAQCTP